MAASTITLDSATLALGGTQTITITSDSPNYTHRINVRCTNANFAEEIYTGVAAGSYTWVVSETYARYLTTLPMTVAVSCGTYEGERFIGLTDATFTVTVPASTMNPASMVVDIGNDSESIHFKAEITRISEYFRHELSYSFGSASGPCTSSRFATFVQWQPNDNLADEIPSATSGPCTLTLTTYDNIGTVVGTTTQTITLRVRDTYPFSPTINTDWTIAPYPTNPSVSQNSAFDGIYVAGTSKIKAANITATAAHSAAIVSYDLIVEGEDTTTSSVAPITTASVIEREGQRRVQVQATDSRGFTVRSTASNYAQILRYSKPALIPYTNEPFQVGRCTGLSATKTDRTGNDMLIRAGRTVSSLGLSNTCSVTYSVKNGSGTVIYSGNLSTSSTTANSWATLHSGSVFTDARYTITLTASDLYGNSDTRVFTVHSITPTIHFAKGGKAIGIGKDVETDNTLDVGWDAYYWKMLRLSEIVNLQALGAATASRIVPVGCYSFGDLGVTSDAGIDVYLTAWIKKVCTQYPNRQNSIFIGGATPNSRGIIMFSIYNTSDVTDGLPAHGTGFFMPHSNSNALPIHRFACYNYEYIRGTFRSEDYTTSSNVAYYATNNTVFTEDAWNTGTKTLRRDRNVVTFQFSAVPTNVSSGGWLRVGTVPEGYRPRDMTYSIKPMWTATYSYSVFRINTLGELSIYKTNTSTAQVIHDMTWITNPR